jgi:hypothetical protein
MERRMRVQVRDWGDTERMMIQETKKSTGNKAEHEWDVGIRNGNGDTAERNSSDVRT